MILWSYPTIEPIWHFQGRKCGFLNSKHAAAKRLFEGRDLTVLVRYYQRVLARVLSAELEAQLVANVKRSICGSDSLIQLTIGKALVFHM